MNYEAHTTKQRYVEIKKNPLLFCHFTDKTEFDITGRLIGGCIDCLRYLPGTKYDKTKEFIDYARTLYNTKIATSFGDDDKFSIFSINNRIEDLESLINDDSFYAVYYMALERIRTLYAKINGIIDLPLMKIEKIYKDSEFAKKYISSPIHKLPDEVFIEQYLKCLKLDDRNVMLGNIKNLYSYSFHQLDFDPNNFCLKYTRKPPFKV